MYQEGNKIKDRSITALRCAQVLRKWNTPKPDRLLNLKKMAGPLSPDYGRDQQSKRGGKPPPFFIHAGSQSFIAPAALTLPG